MHVLGAECPDVVVVCSGRVLFQRGCLDVFILKGMPDVGPFTHLIIGHDGTGPQPGTTSGRQALEPLCCLVVCRAAVCWHPA